jgi:hypothetical protein
MVIVLGVVYYIITLLPLPQPWKNIAIILFLLIALLLFLSYVGVIPDNGWGYRSVR